jgi:hypothetical protein
MHIGELDFSLLYIDVDHVDIEAMETILTLAKKGVAICLKKTPQQPGKVKILAILRNIGKIRTTS